MVVGIEVMGPAPENCRGGADHSAAREKHQVKNEGLKTAENTDKRSKDILPPGRLKMNQQREEC